MKFELLIKEGAQADITEGFRQYRKISPKLGDDFLQKLDDAFEQILSGPEMFATVYQEIRQMKIRRFPYVISYIIEVDRRGVKKLSRRSNPFENGIFLAQLVIISAEIAGQLTPSRSARSFESKLRPSQFTSEFAH